MRQDAIEQAPEAEDQSKDSSEEECSSIHAKLRRRSRVRAVESMDSVESPRATSQNMEGKVSSQSMESDMESSKSASTSKAHRVLSLHISRFAPAASTPAGETGLRVSAAGLDLSVSPSFPLGFSIASDIIIALAVSASLARKRLHINAGGFGPRCRVDVEISWERLGSKSLSPESPRVGLIIRLVQYKPDSDNSSVNSSSLQIQKRWRKWARGEDEKEEHDGSATELKDVDTVPRQRGSKPKNGKQSEPGSSKKGRTRVRG